ncbi:MAG TPA: hypothetical protein VFK88_05080 [Gallionella sp.]|nr:hypothetical protein [Gallionella sp.]
MKMKAAFAFAFILIVGICAGWFGNAYWESRVRKVQSVMAAVRAHEAAQRGDLDKAIEYATYALLLDRDSPVADIQLKEFTKKRADQIAASCNPLPKWEYWSS